MSKLQEVAVANLKLDLHNSRLMPQKNEKEAIRAMINVSGNKFYGILDSLLSMGYLKTENIICQENDKGEVEVREGNRRIAALKIILGIHPISDFDIPGNYVDRVKEITEEFKKENSKVVSLVYTSAKKDSAIVQNIVSLAHSKGESAGRDDWKSVARARYNRDIKQVSEPALDVLEHFIKNSRELSKLNKEQWSADYPITVLSELMRLLAPVLKLENAAAFAKKYPKTPVPKDFDKLIMKIGEKSIGFKEIRSEFDTFLSFLGLKKPAAPGTGGKGSDTAVSGTGGGSTTLTPSAKPRGPVALSNTDPKHIIQKMKKLIIRGNNREKVVALKEEIQKMKKIEDTPYAFCFLLRSMFEISAKEYARENSILLVKTSVVKGVTKTNDKSLAGLLKEVAKDIITKSPEKKDTERLLHSASAELSNPHSVLSVTSMNQLVHSSHFATSGKAIATIFTNVFPLLEAMNK